MKFKIGDVVAASAVSCSYKQIPKDRVGVVIQTMLHTNLRPPSYQLKFSNDIVWWVTKQSVNKIEMNRWTE